MVLYAERGLVVRTRKNLQLFNVLFWTCYCVYIAKASVKYVFPKLIPRPEEDTRFMNLAVLDIIMIEYFGRKKRKYMQSQCLNQITFSLIGGKNRRNIFTGQETRKYFYLILFIMLVDMLRREDLLNFLPEGSPQSFMYFYLTLIFGLYVPIKHIMISKEAFPEMFGKVQHSRLCEFYVRKQEKLTPRPEYSHNYNFVTEYSRGNKTIRQSKNKKIKTPRNMTGSNKSNLRISKNYLTTILEIEEETEVHTETNHMKEFKILEEDKTVFHLHSSRVLSDFPVVDII